MWYEREFPDFDENLHYIYESLNVPATWDYRTQGKAFQIWVDNSWHNDSCPCFGFIAGSPYDENMDLQLFVDYVDPQKSQNADSRADNSIKRFTLYREGGCTCIFNTDDWLEMLTFIKGYIDMLKTAPVVLAEVDISQRMLYKELNKAWPFYFKSGAAQKYREQIGEGY